MLIEWWKPIMPDDFYLFFLESLDKVDRSLRQSEELDQMMKDVLDTVLSVFKSDRSWLLYPCNPWAKSWGVPMERTKKGYPGALIGGKDIPMLPEAIEVFKNALETDQPVSYDKKSNRPLPAQAAKQFSIQSQITVAIYPKMGDPWLFGMHQCSYPRIWTDDEKKLFLEIGRRIADGLNTLLLVQDLKRKEQNYRNVVNNSPDLIYRTDANGVITFVSESVYNISGYTVDEAIGMKMAEEIYVEPDERTAFLNVLMKQGAIENFEAKLKHKSGSVWWASTNAHLLKDSKGKIIGVEGITRNITEKKKVQLALSQSEAYLRTLINTIPDLVWLKDENGRYLFCNSKFERFFGATENEIIGKTDYDFVDKDLADLFRRYDKEVMTKEKSNINEVEVTYADDGHHEILETIKTPMYGKDGQLIGVLGIARDITERKQAEEKRLKLEEELRQSHKMEAIGTISGGIAHDFNNILGIIIGNTELAIDSAEDWHPNRINLEEIKKASLRASDVVRQLLNFSRKTEQRKKTVDVNSLVKESMTLLRSSISKSIDIQMDITEEPSKISADPTQIHQVLINLCTNAAHAMRNEGGILKIDVSEIELDNVTVAQFQKLEPGNYVKITVSDTGHGIDPSIKDKIFDPYFTTKGIGEGTGMGLSVALGIIKNHNGAISVYSEKEKGSCFKVFFPIVDDEIPDGKIAKEKTPTGNEKILLIDDEEALVEIGSNLLQRLGYKVETETDPENALELIRSEPDRFDLIITDMTMPRLNGDELIRKILKINSNLPIILCTGFSNKIDHKKAIEIGARSYIEKPLDKQGLAIVVRNTLNTK